MNKTSEVFTKESNKKGAPDPEVIKRDIKRDEDKHKGGDKNK